MHQSRCALEPVTRERPEVSLNREEQGGSVPGAARTAPGLGTRGRGAGRVDLRLGCATGAAVASCTAGPRERTAEREAIPWEEVGSAEARPGARGLRGRGGGRGRNRKGAKEPMCSAAGSRESDRRLTL